MSSEHWHVIKLVRPDQLNPVGSRAHEVVNTYTSKDRAKRRMGEDKTLMLAGPCYCDSNQMV